MHTAKNRKSESKDIPTEISQTSSIVEPTEKKTPQKTTEKVDSETKMGQVKILCTMKIEFCVGQIPMKKNII